jgi:hypothetical protein
VKKERTKTLIKSDQVIIEARPPFLRQTRVNDEEEKHLETVCLLLALEFGDQR